MGKKLFGIGIIALIFAGFFIAINQTQKPKNESEKIIVITTLFPLYDFAKNIGQDKVEVSLLLPPGVEAHSFEPKPSDIAKVNEADVFVYTGKFMEPWAKDIINGLSGRTVKIVDSSTGIKTISAVSHDKDKPAGPIDPHIWLDFDNAKTMVDNVSQALAEKDPANAQFYNQNAGEYKNSLSRLDSDYRLALSSCKNKEIVYGGHYAFGYLANRYGLTYLAAQGLSPDAEPTAQDLIKLVDQIKKNNIRYIFYEELTSPKIAQTLAGETNAKILLLNAAHNLAKKDFEKNVTFISIMKDNLKNLKIGLDCSE